MPFYHGSPIGGLKELKPFLSEHGKPYIYFSSNPDVALLYAVKPVPKPFSFYPYGFDKNGGIVYSEYFENAFFHLYGGKVGYLYECSSLKNLDNPTQINCAYTCTESVKPDKVTEISDLYAFFRERESKGLFKIKKRNDISEREMQFALGALKKDVDDNDLRRIPQHPMSIFIKEHYPDVWNEK